MVIRAHTPQCITSSHHVPRSSTWRTRWRCMLSSAVSCHPPHRAGSAPRAPTPPRALRCHVSTTSMLSLCSVLPLTHASRLTFAIRPPRQCCDQLVSFDFPHTLPRKAKQQDLPCGGVLWCVVVSRYIFLSRSVPPLLFTDSPYCLLWQWRAGPWWGTTPCTPRAQPGPRPAMQTICFLD